MEPHEYRFTAKERIEKGWSCDTKYAVTDENGQKYLLRVTPKEKSGSRRVMFDMQKRVDALGVPMCSPIDFWENEEGAHLLQRFIDGVDAEDALPTMDEDAQYRLGIDAGHILKTIHSIEAPPDIEDWETRFNRKIDRKIAMYDACSEKFEGDHHVLRYLAENRHLLQGRPQCFQHGDYHTGNMMLENGKLVIIDFDRFDFGDPWEEFNRIVWCAAAAPAFARGMVDGYFGGEPPLLFWQLLALYISSNTLSSLPWAIAFGEKEAETMRKQAADVLQWYDNMQRAVPRWYREQQ